MSRRRPLPLCGSTSYEPGSPSKVAILQLRLFRHEQLHHPDDKKLQNRAPGDISRTLAALGHARNANRWEPRGDG